MDVGYFICELLAQQGEVSVPGLGYFAHTRLNGYYNEADGSFYPPSFSIQFDQQSIDDDTLAQYIADKKNISLASSKYFTGKYTSNIKQQAATGEIALGDMGWFYTSQQQLAFRPNKSTTAHPEFFGYPVVTLGKTAVPEVEVPVPAVAVTEPAANPVPVIDEPQFESDEQHEEYLVALARKKRTRTIITFVILAVLFAAVIAFLLYKYDRAQLGINQVIHSETNKSVPPPPTIIGADASKGDTSKGKTDTAKKPRTVLVGDTTQAKEDLADTLSYPRWEVIGGSFKFKKEADAAVADYKTRGIEARIATEVPGPRFKIGLGTYTTQATANKAVRALKKNKKIKEDIYPLEIKKKL